MEARKITVVSTRNQKKSVIMSAATTLAELKADLRQNGIDYEGMTFYEGTSKIELKDDNSVLPHDVPYKGQTTNELVFMLTNTNKKIRSGAAMSRADVYAAIKAKGLQGECVKRFGKNFTMCKTTDLITLIYEKSASKPIPTTPTKGKKVAEAKEEKVKECTCTNDKHMFELKSNSELGIRFFFKVFDSNHIVFSLIGHKSDYGDKSKKKKGETAQNKDMKRALDIANHYMESKILK